MSFVLNILLYLWQLPQHIIGAICLQIWKDTCIVTYKDKKIHVCAYIHSGISLGNYIIVRNYPHNKDTWNSVKHEYGHSIQSKRLGWLYLIVIGLPSIIFNIYDRLFHTEAGGWDYKRSNKWYYNLPWEKDADKKGNVVREYE